MSITRDAIRRYYGPNALTQRVAGALSALDKPLDMLTLDDIAVIDEFHIRGQQATRELIALAGFAPQSSVLDLGCGLGGAARRLAASADCHVTGIDLSEEFVVCAQYLSALLKLQDAVSFRQGNCLALPFADASFDGAWTIQMMMNIDQKQVLLNEVRRVLKPGARFVLYEIMAGNQQALHFPLPWAQGPEHNCLCTMADMKTLLTGAGFVIDSWQDMTATARQAFADMPEPAPGVELPPLGVHFLVGDDIRSKAYNVKRNLDQGRIELLQAVVVNGI